ncbi:MAG: hypothetical protein UY77_C0041G0006 [Candidatus Uhrbacteria bacterium GW2011_GWA2_53_10]|uniref:Uncharacterized protein n=1 Tax=Candidatus Uhrbacteria bacterium GW2011_GWA2_53_10 TaxID=1618980 RepID=A0A0G1ZU98_9BACT|nr:MAG: hypothetical protein UY77_C0041G0006 [Candidatus Uhrbacteria bacterium GW2011_GWA2_53_10]
MKGGEVEHPFVAQGDDRGLKQVFVRAVLAPAPMPFVYVRPMDLVALDRQLVPLNARVQDKQNMVEDLKRRQLSLRSALRSGQMG